MLLQPKIYIFCLEPNRNLLFSNFLTFSKKPLDRKFHEKLGSIQCCSLDNNETIKIESAFSAADKSSSVSSRHIQYTRTILDFMRQGQSWNPLLISHLEKKVVLAPRVWHLLPLPLTRNLGVPETGGNGGGTTPPPRFWQISLPISTKGADNAPPPTPVRI